MAFRNIIHKPLRHTTPAMNRHGITVEVPVVEPVLILDTHIEPEHVVIAESKIGPIPEVKEVYETEPQEVIETIPETETKSRKGRGSNKNKSKNND